MKLSQENQIRRIDAAIGIYHKKSESVIESIIDAILNLRKAVYKYISGRDIEVTKKVLRKMTENANSFISEKPKRAKKQ